MKGYNNGIQLFKFICKMVQYAYDIATTNLRRLLSANI